MFCMRSMLVYSLCCLATLSNIDKLANSQLAQERKTSAVDCIAEKDTNQVVLVEKYSYLPHKESYILRSPF